VNHCIDVVDDDARPLFSFGGFGTGPGQFNEPSDAVIVYGEPGAGSRWDDFPLLAVADRGNHRVQLFEPDGALLATIDPWRVRGKHPDLPVRAGSPFFRVNPIPQLVLPARLAWRRPHLDVLTAGGVVVALDLEMARRPDFDTWLATATHSTARRALEYFSQDSHLNEIPALLLSRIAERAKSHLRIVPRRAGR
jgi:hypothetical protein